MKFRNIAVIACALTFGISAIAEEPVEWKHFNELFWKGTITDASGQTFKAILIPGFDNISKDAGENWVDAGKAIGKLADGKFWSKRWDNVKDAAELSKDAFTDYWYKGIKDDFNETVKDNASIKPGEFGSAVMPFLNWVKFGFISVLGRTVTAPVGAAVVMAGYGIIWPVGHIMWQPLEAAGYAVVGGATIPSVLYVWNGFAWVGTTSTNMFSNVPTSESHFFHIVPKGRSGELVIDQQSFENIVHASTKRVLTNDQIAVLDKKVDAIEKKVEEVVAPYRAEQAEIRAEERKVEDTFNQDPAQKQLVDAINKAYEVATVKLSSEARDVYMNQEQMTALILAYLKNLGIESPTQEMVDRITDQINQTLERLRIEMENGAKTPNP